MTQDEQLAAALTRLEAALVSLEAASRRIVDSNRTRGADAPGISGELADVAAKAEKLEAANEEVARALKVATEALAAILSRRAEPTED